MTRLDHQTGSPRGRTRRSLLRRSWLGCAWAGLLAAVILAGCWLVPLHGDEPTVIYMSLDVDALRRADFAALAYRDPLPLNNTQAATRQDLRLINGVLNKYVYGALWLGAGMPPTAINDQWLWGADLAFNTANGHVPSDGLLFLTRWGSGLLTVLSAALAFAIGRRVGGMRVGAAASLIYTLMPSVLLNGRRAMMESGLLLGGALVIYGGLILAARLARPAAPQWWIRAAVFGAAAGLAIAAKHTGLVLVAAVAAGVGVAAAISRQGAIVVHAMAALAFAGLIAALLFLTLNPAWWPDPLAMPGRVLAARSALLAGQVRTFGGYQTFGERAAGFVQELLAAPSQYYEVGEGWPDWIGPQIARYEAAGGGLLAGLSGPAWGAAFALLLVIGTARAVRRWAQPPILICLIAAALSAVAVFALTPLHWQRYYLPLALPAALLASFAFLPPLERV